MFSIDHDAKFKFRTNFRTLFLDLNAFFDPGFNRSSTFSTHQPFHCIIVFNFITRSFGKGSLIYGLNNNLFSLKQKWIHVEKSQIPWKREEKSGTLGQHTYQPMQILFLNWRWKINTNKNKAASRFIFYFQSTSISKGLRAASRLPQKTETFIHPICLKHEK